MYINAGSKNFHVESGNYLEHFGDIRWIPLFQPSRKCPLKFVDLLVYSFLAFSSRRNHVGASKRRIAHRCQVDRCRTLPASLARLRKVGLVTETDGPRYLALRPAGQTAGWFTAMKTPPGPHWSEGLAYLRYPLRRPESILNNSQVAVWAQLLSLQSRGLLGATSKYRISRYLGLSHQSVGRALKALADLQFVEGWTPSDIPETQFQRTRTAPAAKPVAKPEPEPEPQSKPAAPPATTPYDLDGAKLSESDIEQLRHLEDLGLQEDHALTIWAYCRVLDTGLMLAWLDIEQSAKAQHQVNGKGGSYQALLRWKVQQFLVRRGFGGDERVRDLFRRKPKPSSC